MTNQPTAYKPQMAGVNPAAQAMILAYSEHMGITPEGVNVLGGKPYINFTGLITKARNLGLKGIKVELQREATKENQLSAMAKATVYMNDGSEFEDFGLASPGSVQMTSLHKADFLTQMAITRAKNRALRSATGVGHTSAEEIKDAHDRYAPTTRLDAGIDLDSGEVLDEEMEDLLANAGAPEVTEEGVAPPQDFDIVQKGEEIKGTVTVHADQMEEPAKEEPVAPEAPTPSGNPAISYQKLQKIIALRNLIKEAGKDEKVIIEYYKVDRLEDLSDEHIDALMERLTSMIAEQVFGMDESIAAAEKVTPPAPEKKAPAKRSTAKKPKEEVAPVVSPSAGFYNDMPPVNS